MRKPQVVVSLKRDIPLLVFLWRWKVVSTRALHARFFAPSSLKRCYDRLRRLELSGLIACASDNGSEGRVWSIAKSGFHAIRNELPALSEEGFKSENVHHDLLCAALHLGDWLLGQPDTVSLFSEQQLRRYETDYYPEWVPRSKAHRPDGYTRIGSRLIALEVELSPKPISAYRSIGGFYSQNPTIDRVLWMLNRTSTAESLKTHLAAYGSSQSPVHNFVTVPEFSKLGWRTPIIAGPERGTTVEMFFKHQARGKVGESQGSSPSLLFFDTKKSYVKSPQSVPA